MTKHEREQVNLCIKLLKQSGKNTKQVVKLLLEDMMENEEAVEEAGD